jgi:hypothetical protein
VPSSHPVVDLNAVDSSFNRPIIGVGQTTTYSPSKFYVRATDEKGHHDRVTFKTPPLLISQIMALVTSGEFPDYRTAADFYRDALLHHLHTRIDGVKSLSMREGIQETLQMLVDEDRADRAVEFSLRRRKVIEKQRNAFVMFHQDGAWVQLHDHIADVRVGAQGHEEPYKSQLLKLCDDYQAHIPDDVLKEIQADEP